VNSWNLGFGSAHRFGPRRSAGIASRCLRIRAGSSDALTTLVVSFDS